MRSFAITLGTDKNISIYIEEKRHYSFKSIVTGLFTFLAFIYPKAVKIICSLLISIGAAYVLLPMAKAERGYEAIGGEWILISVIFILSLYLFNFIVKVGK